MYIETLEGIHKADIGDYIITGVKGEQYPCKPDIFEQTYEPEDLKGSKSTRLKYSGRAIAPPRLSLVSARGRPFSPRGEEAVLCSCQQPQAAYWVQQ